MNIFKSFAAACDEFKRQNGHLTRRRQVYAALNSTSTSGQLNVYIDGALMAMIVAALLSIVLESVQMWNKHYGWLLDLFEYFSVAVFSIEYALRVYAAPEHPAYAGKTRPHWRYMRSFPAAIDALAIFPFYIELLLGMLVGVDLRFLRILRMTRLLKMTRYNNSLNTLVRVMAREASVLMAAGFLMLMLVLVAASMGYLLERAAQPDKFENIPQAIYWAVITLASVGYGDLAPVTPAGRVMTIVMAVIGVGIFALPAGLLASAFADQLRLDRERLQRTMREAMGDGNLTADQRAAIQFEADRLHLSKEDVDYLLGSIEREAAESASEQAKSSDGGFVDWRHNPNMAFEHINKLLSDVKSIIASSDVERLQAMFDDPARASLHHRQLFEQMRAQSSFNQD